MSNAKNGFYTHSLHLMYPIDANVAIWRKRTRKRWCSCEWTFRLCASNGVQCPQQFFPNANITIEYKANYVWSSSSFNWRFIYIRAKATSLKMVHRKCYWVFTLGSDKDQRKNYFCFRFSSNINEPWQAQSTKFLNGYSAHSVCDAANG